MSMDYVSLLSSVSTEDLRSELERRDSLSAMSLKCEMCGNISTAFEWDKKAEDYFGNGVDSISSKIKGNTVKRTVCFPCPKCNGTIAGGSITVVK